MLQLLNEVVKQYQVIIWTASHQSYADVVIDYLDPDKKFFEYRLYRESCTLVDNNVYIKDLNIFKNRNLKNLIIIDNCVSSFGFQLNNGIPIIPFYDNTNDEELHHLKTYLEVMSKQEDVREQNKYAFQLESISNEYIEKYLQEFNMLSEAPSEQRVTSMN